MNMVPLKKLKKLQLLYASQSKTIYYLQIWPINQMLHSATNCNHRNSSITHEGFLGSCLKVFYCVIVTFCITGCSQIADKLVEVVFTKENGTKTAPQAPIVNPPARSTETTNIDTKQAPAQATHETRQQSSEQAPSTNSNEALTSITTTSPTVIKHAAPKPHPTQPVDVSGMKNNDW